MLIQIIIAALVSAVMGLTTHSTEAWSNGKATTTATIQQGYSPIVVLELFTSQGCSSCPPADALLKRVKAKGDASVFTLSYHVDYWNHIGWEDPFSQHAFTEKQRLYSLKFKNRSIYTPQMVINGISHFVGSDAAVLALKTATYSKIMAANMVEIKELTMQLDRVKFSYSVSGDLAGKIVRAVLVLDERTTEISRGENKNRKLTNSNIVIAEQLSNAKAGPERMSVLLPKFLLPGDRLELILLIADKDYTITGAAKVRVQA